MWLHLERVADTEASLAKLMPPVDKWGKEQYYHQRFLLPLIQKECEYFVDKGLKISPADVTNILFRCKMAFEFSDEKEYHKRVGGGSYVDESQFVVPWRDKTKGYQAIIEEYFERLKGFVQSQTLVTTVSYFDTPFGDVQAFFDGLFAKLSLPFVCFLKASQLVAKHQQYQPHLRQYNKKEAKNFFHSPSIGFATEGSMTYAYWYASAWLRTFFNMLRIASFIYRPQMDFGQSDVRLEAPTSPVLLNSGYLGVFSWDEDKREPWLKTPDGCLFLSYGYRGLAKMYIDDRTFGGIEKFFLENQKILDSLKNPWTERSVNDIQPTLDILSSATQIPDLGAKILLMYCSLEHLFVPKNVNSDNKKYIVGGIHALKPELLPWFNDLYKLRCAYAHKGFILKDDKTLSLVFKSMENVIALLLVKIS